VPRGNEAQCASFPRVDLLVDYAVRSGDFQIGVSVFSFIHIGHALFAPDVPLRLYNAQRPVVAAARSETTRRQSRSRRADAFRRGRANPAAAAEAGARRRGDQR